MTNKETIVDILHNNFESLHYHLGSFSILIIKHIGEHLSHSQNEIFSIG